MFERRVFQREKLRELIVYLARKSAGDPTFCAAKVNRLLFFSDFEAYRRWGRAITGACYQKIKDAPVPCELSLVLEELERERVIVEIDSPDRGRQRKAMVARRDAVLAAFSPDEIALVDEIIDRFRETDGRRASERDHDFIGLTYARDSEDIPYETALLRPEPPTAGDIARAALLRSNGWVDFDSVR